ncbi:hypothetical protein H112_00675 [Trichophyton rubrum D6]|uniref:Uncharacterized protein n=3 Tax=Trichophyton rubrum TaxID=5551 RepID=F2SZ24_TRIRC|nr:uncharacterized protein TERG_07794 [Trichophyton rubrum CBS 118892]EZF57050.1 hypothetical protein H103_00674 [Trichophyton rubrum CBS 288.86]EZF99786.1 hypothetical protein H113_00676 [Trichophyton rubrum MR1459]EZG21253.1 hypothetical protein H107_00724 [Trichophyton rubrum CBS 202.88]KDB38113.1 hypothetical protein H112_00675 [Trichophyton rubrum D6]KMQ45414.1 hypothetical protein HL42_3884 [Trichophyton rubrum]
MDLVPPPRPLHVSEHKNMAATLHRSIGKKRFLLIESMQNPKPFEYTDTNYESGPTLSVVTPTRLPTQPQGYGTPALSLPHYPVPPAEHYQSLSRDTSGMRGTFHSPYAQFSTEQSPPRELSQTRETTLPHRPPPFGHHQSLSRDPSMRQGGSPDRQTERHDSGPRDKGKGKAKERLDSTGGCNLRSRSDKGESSKGRGKDKDDDEKRGRFPGPFSRKC